MVVVATSAIFLGGLILKRRSDYFWARAIYYAECEKSCADLANDLEADSKELAERPDKFLDLVFSLGTNTNRGRSAKAKTYAQRARIDADSCGELKRKFRHFSLISTVFSGRLT